MKQNIELKITAKAVIGGICYIINNKIDFNYSYPERIEELNDKTVREILENIWKDGSIDGEKETCLELIISQLAEFKEEFITIKNTI